MRLARLVVVMVAVSCRGREAAHDIAPVASEPPTPKPKTRCPDNMVFIAGGAVPYVHGKPTGIRDLEREIVQLSDFCIDKTEVSMKSYKTCAECAFGNGQDCEYLEEQMPAACVSWIDADRFCRDVRKGRLPSEAEWELAARGPNLFKYPWGDDDDPQKAVCEVRKMPCRLDKPDDDISPFGVLGMGYSVAEWTRTCFDSPKCEAMIVAGRSFRFAERVDLENARQALTRDYGQLTDVGFRCVADPR